MMEDPRDRGRARPVLIAVGVLALAVTLVAGIVVGGLLNRDSAMEVPPSEKSVDVGFARDMREHHAQAVQMSLLVREATASAEVRRLALDILLTQQQQQGQMYGWLAGWGRDQTSSEARMSWMSGSGEDMGGGHQSMSDDKPVDGTMPGMASKTDLAALAGARGVRAERLFLQLMIPHHRGGVSMAEYAAENARQPHVRRLAESIVRSQTAELDVLEKLLSARGGPLDES